MLLIRKDHTLTSRLQRLSYTASLYSLAVLIAVSVPMAAAYADDPEPQATPTPVVESTAPSAETATTSPAPTTAESTAPASAPAAEPQRTYTYDSESGRWNTDEWQYDKTTDTYVAAPKPPSAEAVQATTPTQSTNPTSSTTATAESSTITNTAVTNALNSLAQSGNADVLHNTTAGNATTGGALATATVINNVNSIVTNANNQEVATFVTDVMGDTNGDIILQPMLLKAMLEAGSAQTNTQATATINTGLQNDLQLAAVSGNATVSQNGSAGNATTGAANTVADVVNIVNSMVSANQSFIGTINIYGNLNGDILIAPDFIPQLLASNSDIQANTASANTTVSSQDTQEIINNVSLAAESGQAIVDRNTSAGNALSGDANTNLVIFNLSGHEIVAENSLLVFVNVLGSWVGVIVDAPTGATAGAIGNNVSGSTTANPNLILSVDNTTKIVNNLDLTSRSGDATVASNTLAGNATTGNATASANILNMSSSQLNLAGWFGILFINVFGTWNGSFGIDTAAGTRAVVPPPKGKANQPPQVMQFVPRARTVAAPVKMTVVTPEGTTEQEAASQAPTAKLTKAVLPGTASPTMLTQAMAPARPIDLSVLVGSFVLIIVSAYGVRRYLL